MIGIFKTNHVTAWTIFNILVLTATVYLCTTQGWWGLFMLFGLTKFE